MADEQAVADEPTTAAEPTTDDAEPTTAAEPATDDAEPTMAAGPTTAGEPVPADDGPTTTDHEPATADAEPATADAEPATADAEPATADAEPATADGERTPAGEAIHRSAIPPAEPADPEPLGGWLVSARPAHGPLRLIDCSPVAKLVVQAPPAGVVAEQLAIPMGRTELFEDGLLATCLAPGEWLVLCPGDPARFLAGLRSSAGDEPTAVLDVTQGRTVLRLTGPEAGDLLAELCEIDLGDRAFPVGSAIQARVAGVRTGILRDDLFADEAGWPAPVDLDLTDSGASEEADVRSYLLHCDRSAGRYLYDQLLDVGARRGIEEEGYALHRARRSDL
jgi:heterotetrameric sarcosine oxidase gamma subunit